MATSKPQLNVYVSAEMRAAIQEYSERTGIPQGKLIEQAWRFFQMSDIPLLRSKVTKLVLDGLRDQDLSELYQLSTVLSNALKNKMGR